MEWNEKKIIKYIVLIAVLVLAIMNIQFVMNFISNLMSVASPITFSVVIAYVLNILMVRFEKVIDSQKSLEAIRKFKRPISILLAILIIFAIVILVMVLVLPQLVNLVAALIESIPTTVTSIQNWVNAQQGSFPIIGDLLQQLNIDWSSFAIDSINFLNDFSQNILSSMIVLIGNAFASTVNFILSLMLAIYMLASKEKLLNQLSRIANAYFSHKFVSTTYYVWTEINRAFVNFFTGAVIEAIILGVSVAVGMMLIGLPYAAMIGVLTGVLALIPLLGAYLSAAIGFVLILPQSFSQAIIFLIFITILQQIEGNFIYAKVVGNSIGLPGMWVLMAVTLGGGLFGVAGMVIGVPLAAAIYSILKSDVSRRELNEQTFQEFVDVKNIENNSP